jgi:hypothetical protein
MKVLSLCSLVMTIAALSGCSPAESSAEKGDWAVAKDDGSIGAYSAFVDKYPQSRHRSEVFADDRVVAVLHGLVERFDTWSDADRKVVDNLLKIDSTNPYALSLIGFDQLRSRGRAAAKDTFAKAMTVTKDEKVSDIAKMCVAWGDVITVVGPVWKGPDADAQRKKLLASPPKLSGFMANGTCFDSLVFIETSTKPEAPERMLKHYIDRWAKASD